MVPVQRLGGQDDPSGSDRPDDGAKQFPEPDTASKAPAANLIGKKFSHYRVLEVLGGGDMGMLYKAEDLKLGRRVALKFLPEELAWDTVALQRFEREARAACLLDHPNICTIYEVEEHEGQPFIVMQVIQGETLRDRLAALAASRKTLAIDELRNIAIQICDGLQAAHAKGIIHRNIKPANIFLTPTGQVKILDFGVAKLDGAARETEGDGLDREPDRQAAALQPARWSPGRHNAYAVRQGGRYEGLHVAGTGSGRTFGPASDLFSLRLVLYQMATGQRSFSGETARWSTTPS
jgi:serine/threonine protein kinase